MSDRAPYSRVYWQVLSDEKFVEVRQDMRAFGSWTLMLLVADMSWPAPAYVPPVVTKASLDKLATAGIVDLIPGGMYRVRGLDRERAKRQAAARRDPDGSQSGPKRDPVARIAEPSLAEAEKEPSQAEDAREDLVDDYYRLTNRFPTSTVTEWLERLANEFGYDQASKKLASEFTKDHSTKTLLGRVENELKADVHGAKRRAAEAEKQRLEEWNKSRQVTPEQAAENRRRIAEIQREWFGKGAA